MGGQYYDVLRRNIRGDKTLMQPYLSAIGLTKRYGEKPALEGVDIEINEGDFLSVFGANGAGKSTFLKALSGQIKLTRGALYYKGRAVKDAGDDYRKKLGVISHQSFLYDGFSALENLIHYAGLYDVPEPRKRAEELLKRLDMAKRMHDPVSSYSRGMLQRTSIARALLNDPEIVIMDEPYTGLDRKASLMLTALLKEQTQKNAAVILVTHDLSLGYELAAKVLILSRGKTAYFAEKPESEREFTDIYTAIA
ncbi:MAG: ABC transporter ATP-binding protein [Deferribacteraceae bacterium]|jgi:heme exporter protein A|nr:ABC transporter ATP-binding protein [Deferribacteraceae bacterium]